MTADDDHHFEHLTPGNGVLSGTSMNEHEPASPNDRLEKLEREAQQLASRLKQSTAQISILQLAILLGAAGLFGIGYYLIKTGQVRVEGLAATIPPKVEMKEFGLYNRGGDRVIFGTLDNRGNPELIFLDTNKRACMRVKVWPDHGGTPGLVFSDTRGLRGILRIDPEGASVLNLVGKDQKGSITLSVTEDGTPGITMEDKAGKVIWQVPANSK
jgi:hypothetical protein